MIHGKIGAVIRRKPLSGIAGGFPGIKPADKKSNVDSHGLSLGIRVHGAGDHVSEHLIQRGILYQLLADLIVELKSSDHIGGGQLLFRDKIAFQLFRYGEALGILVYVIPVGIAQPQVGADGIGILIVLFPMAVVIFYTETVGLGLEPVDAAA